MGEKKKTKKLTLRGPSKDFRKSANMEMKTKKKIKQKVKKKKNWRRTVNKNPRIFMCDRCGRDGFTNGHALGGHKKYCQKPQYDEAREKKLNRIQFCMLVKVNLLPDAKAQAKASLPNHVANLPHKLVLS